MMIIVMTPRQRYDIHLSYFLCIVALFLKTKIPIRSTEVRLASHVGQEIEFRNDGVYCEDRLEMKLREIC